MPTSIVNRNYGDPEVLKLEEVPKLTPKPKELLIRQTAIGINFHDIYCRSGLYKTVTKVLIQEFSTFQQIDTKGNR